MTTRKARGGVAFHIAPRPAPPARPHLWGALAWCILAPGAFLAGWFLAAWGL